MSTHFVTSFFHGKIFLSMFGVKRLDADKPMRLTQRAPDW